MSQKFKTVLTNAGVQKLAAGLPPDGKKVIFTEMAVGDGGGALPEPKPEQTALVREVYRELINTITPHPKYANCVVAEMIIPPNRGGFWMRELGLYDSEGVLIAVANMAESYKPLLEEGSGRASTVRMVIAVSNLASVELQIDSSTVTATKDYVDDALDKHAKSRNHPDATLKEKGFVQLSSATDSDNEELAATPKAVKVAVDAAAAADESAGKRLLKSNNFSDVADKVAARQNIGLGDIATHKVSEFVPVGRKINNKSLEGDISLTPADVGAVSATGGNVGYLNDSDYYATKDGVWPGNGGFYNQLADRRALFYSAGFTAPSGNSTYYPLNKSTMQTQGLGYMAAISHGVLVSGGSDFPRYCIHIKPDLGSGKYKDSVWTFNTNDDSFSSPGGVTAGGEIRTTAGSIVAAQGLFESGGAVRAYSPNNPPPQQNLSPYATIAWVQQYAVSDVRQASIVYQGAEKDSGVRIAPAGAVFVGTNVIGEWDNNEGFYYTFMQKCINGNYYNLGRV